MDHDSLKNILLNAGILLSCIALIFGIFQTWSQYAADKAMAEELWKIAQQKNAIGKLQKFRTQLYTERNISKSLQTDLDILLADAIKHLENSDRRFVKIGINQPSLSGKRNYELKLIIKALQHAA